MSERGPVPPVKIFGFALAIWLLWVGAWTSAAVPQTAGLTDPQIVSIAYTAGNIDIENAKLALTKSQDQAIRTLARDMIRDHTAANERALALVKRLHMTPQDNPASRSLVRQADNIRAQLAQMSGKDFDRAYIDNELAYHKAVAKALETRLIPAARHRQLKSLLAAELKIFEGQQRRAEGIARRLG